MKLNNNKLAYTIASTVAAPTLLTTAFMQDVQAAALEEIVVVAQRREQNLQDVPIAIQAFTDQMLSDNGISNITDLGAVSPSVTVTKQLLAILPYIRGVGSPNASAGTETPVAVYLDGVYLSNVNGTMLSFNSVEQIEVLKGPQGTLFGRNSTAGLLHIITKDPTQETQVTGSVSYGNYDTSETKIYATTGITENIAADVALLYRDQGDGYGDNLNLNKDINFWDERAVRTKWLITPGDDTEIRLTADAWDVDSTLGVHHSQVPGSLAIDGQIFFAGCVAGLGGNPGAPTPDQFGICQPVGADMATKAVDDFQDSVSSRRGELNARGFGASATLKHQMGDLEFVSITGYRDNVVNQLFEQAAAAIDVVIIDNTQYYDTFTQEFQLLGESDSMDWIVGAFYLQDSSDLPRPDGIIVSGIGVGGVLNKIALIDTTSYSVFGELTYHLSDRLNLTAGLRWTKDKREVEWQDIFNGFAFPVVEDEESWDEPTYRLILDYQLNEDVMVYGSYSRGFKSGSFNNTTGGTPPFDPEIIDAYELGTKATLAGGTIQLNAATWFYDITDMQTTRIVEGSVLTVNAAEAEIKGIEMDFLANLTDNLQLRGGFTYVDHEFTSFPDAVGFVPNALGLGGNDSVILDVSGEKIPKVPDTTFNLGFNYGIPLEFGEVTLGANYSYNDGYAWEVSGRTEQDSFELVNAYASWTHPDSTWGLRLWGQNLTDEEYALFSLEQALGDQYAAAAPRTYGIELSFEF